MLHKRMALKLVILSGILFLSACTSHQLYRSDTSICVSGNPVQECSTNALQQYVDPADKQKTHLMGFIEFDDQGQLWDRNQMDAVISQVNEEAGKGDVLIMTFVHGWKHNAEAGDDNVKTFRTTLRRLTELENRFGEASGQPPRQVIGIYLGWRGRSVSMPLLKELTFWDRKNTAQKIGHGGVTEVLTRLELVKKTRDAIEINDAIAKELKKAKPDLEKANLATSKTRLVVIGHSFGGAVVFSALSQIIEGRFIDTHGPQGQLTGARSFGDLVVLINPAFEATQFSALSDMAAERGSYFPSQLPVMVVLTSEADYATKIAFPIGRWFSTLFENEHDVSRKNAVTRKEEVIDQGKSNITTVGHFLPYRTHYLSATEDVDRESIAAPTVEEDIQRLFALEDRWEQDAPGSTINFFGSTLERTKNSAGRNPYMVVQVDKHLIRDHSDIDDPRVIAFIRQIILLASQGEELKAQQTELKKALNVK